MREAPVHLAVFCDEATAKGAGLGAQTMAEARAYSVVGAITQFWLAARAEGLGLGWVSFYREEFVRELLGIPAGIRPVAWLCLGTVSHLEDTPDLERSRWRHRRPLEQARHCEGWNGTR